MNGGEGRREKVEKKVKERRVVRKLEREKIKKDKEY